MPLVEELQKRIRQAMKDGDNVAREVLRVALGEIQMGEARSGNAPTDEDAAAVIRKLIKSNEETISLSQEGEGKTTLGRENEILRDLLPRSLSVPEIVAALAGVAAAIRDAKSDGQATGVAMKALKASGANVDGKDVGAAIKEMRSTLPRSRRGSAARLPSPAPPAVRRPRARPAARRRAAPRGRPAPGTRCPRASDPVGPSPRPR
jgi:uncharacterized protein